MKLRIGFEKGTGALVDVDLSPTSPHVAIFGQTGLGKTTLVRRLIAQVPKGYRILVFDTREDVEEWEASGRHVPIYVRQDTDPLVLKGLLESILQSSLKREYATLIRATAGARDYREVVRRLDRLLEEKRTHPVVRDMALVLKDLLQRLMVEMEEAETAGDVDLREGLNVMVLNHQTKEFKQLVVRTVLPLVYKKYRRMVVFLDEGQVFIPQKYSSAAKEAVDDYIRTARGKEDYLVIAAQSMTGTDKAPLKSVHTWVMFGQATPGEATEALEYLPHAEALGLTRRELQTMETGWAVVSTKRWAKRAYVQPLGMGDGEARAVAVGDLQVKDAIVIESSEEVEDTEQKEREAYEAKIMELEKRIIKLEDQAADWRAKYEELSQRMRSVASTAPPQESKRPLMTRMLDPKEGEEDGPTVQVGPIAIEAQEREVVVRYSTEVREFNAKTTKGRIMQVLLQDLERSGTMGEISEALQERGWNIHRNTLSPELGGMVKEGDLVRQEGDKVAKTGARYRIPGKVKVRVEE